LTEGNGGEGGGQQKTKVKGYCRTRPALDVRSSEWARYSGDRYHLTPLVRIKRRKRITGEGEYLRTETLDLSRLVIQIKKKKAIIGFLTIRPRMLVREEART